MKHIAFVMVILLLLCSCSTQQSEGPAPETAPGAESGSSISETRVSEEPAKTQPGFVNKSFYETAGHYRWSDNGEYLVAQIGNSLHYIDHNNNDIKATAFESDSIEHNCILRWNDNMVFAASTENYLFPLETRIIMQNGKYIINNAKIYKIDGTLVKDFPVVDDVGLIYESEEIFEASVRQNLDRVLWVDDDTLAINTQSRVFIYSISKDKLELIDDMTKEVAAGWTIGASNSFGALEHWVANGRYYYITCRTLDNNQQQQTALYTADMENGARSVLGEDWYYTHKIRDGKLILQTDRYGDAAEIPEQYRATFPFIMTNVEYVELPAAGWPVPIGEFFSDGKLFLNDSRYIAWHENQIDGESVERVFHCFDTETGTDITFMPQKYDSTPLIYGPWSYNLVNFRVVDGSAQFIYYTSDLQGTTALSDGSISENWITPYYLYDTATDTRKLISDFWHLPDEASFNTAKTHFVEAESYNNIRVCKLD